MNPRVYSEVIFRIIALYYTVLYQFAEKRYEKKFSEQEAEASLIKEYQLFISQALPVIEGRVANFSMSIDDGVFNVSFEAFKDGFILKLTSSEDELVSGLYFHYDLFHEETDPFRLSETPGVKDDLNSPPWLLTRLLKVANIRKKNNTVIIKLPSFQDFLTKTHIPLTFKADA